MRIPYSFLVVLVLLALAPAASGARQASTNQAAIGPVTPLTSPAPDGSAQPNLTTDARGRVWLSWLEPRAGGGHRFRLSSLTGSTWSAPVTIAEGANFLANWADFPSVFVAADGTMAAHWLERGAGREAYFIRIRTTKDGGRTWTPTLTPHRDESATEHGFVSFFEEPGGGIGLTWLDGREIAAAGGGHAAAGHGANMTLRATTIRNGAVGPEMVIDNRVCDCCQTSAARAGNAVLVVYRDRTDKEIRDTSVVRYVNGAWSAPVTVHNDGWELNGCPVNGPVVAASGQAAAVAWFTGAGGTPKSLVAFSPDGGRTFGPPIRVDVNTTLGRLGMVMPSADRVLITSLERGANGGRLVLRDVRRNGTISDPIHISDATPDRSGGFARLVRTGRRLVVAWTVVKSGAPPRVSVATLELR